MRVPPLAILFLATSTPTFAQNVTFSDDTFANVDWSGTKIVDTTAGAAATFTAGQIGTGGNPGAYRETIQSYCMGFVQVAHAKLNAVYDPALNGPIGSVDAAFDLRHFSPPAGQAVEYRVLVLQAGNFYGSGPGSLVFDDNWKTFTKVGLTSTDFALLAGTGPPHPNFLSTGSSITVGYVTSNSSGSACITRTSGIDNWSITLKPQCPSQQASETARLGTPPNPGAFLPGVTTGPIVGRTWDPVIDHTTFATTAVADFVAISLQGATNVQTGLGTLLILPPFHNPVVFSTPGTPFAIPIPNNCSFLGASVWTQGASLSPGPVIELTNALDLVLGNV